MVRAPFTPLLLPVVALVLLLGGAACGSARTGSTSAEQDRLLTREEIAQAGVVYPNAYELVATLRPQWLRKRGRGEQGDVVVYVNDVRAGGPSALRSLDADAVVEMRFLDAAAATRYGSGHQHGVIAVRTR